MPQNHERPGVHPTEPRRRPVRKHVPVGQPRECSSLHPVLGLSLLADFCIATRKRYRALVCAGEDERHLALAEQLRVCFDQVRPGAVSLAITPHGPCWPEVAGHMRIA